MMRTPVVRALESRLMRTRLWRADSPHNLRPEPAEVLTEEGR